ncbi:MAG TPA: cupin domain-containing protein [Vicinamibacterales bacterium]|nr:cupin domain-containing protein [Vicinamibacterales bacterium]
MVARIERWDVRLDGPLSEAALQRKIEMLGYEVRARVYPAGRVATAAFDPRQAITAVVRGVVQLTVNDEPEMLTAGDLAFVPAGISRRLEVVGPGTALCLEAFRAD